MALVDPILAEMEHEFRTTRKVLQAVPQDKLAWKPHAKSMSLGELAWHIATVPGFVAATLPTDGHDFATRSPRPPMPATTAEIVAGFDAAWAQAREALKKLDDAQARGDWKIMAAGQTKMTLPRLGLVRSILMNHSFHHRGQLSVYLRLLDVPVPSIYGPSADENPLA